MNKLELLERMDEIGIGYCSKKSCELDEMGVGVTWKQILEIDVDDLFDMYAFFKWDHPNV